MNLTDAQRAGKHYSTGFDLSAKKMHREAAIEFQKAIEIDPLYGLAWMFLADALGEQNLCEEAERACRKAIELGATDAYSLAHLFEKCGKLQEAEKIYQNEIDQAPTDTEWMGRFAYYLERQDRKSDAYSAYLSLAQIYLDRREDFSNSRWAEISLKQAIEILPDNPEAHQLLKVAHGRLDEIYRKSEEEDAQSDLVFVLKQRAFDLEAQGNIAEARKAMALALAMGPKDTGTYFVYAYLSWLDGANDAAERACLSAIELEDDYDTAWYLLGLISLQGKKYERAATAFRRVTNLRDHDYDWFLLGSALLMMQRMSEAEVAFDKALELNPKMFGLVSELLESNKAGNIDNVLKLTRSVHATRSVQGLSTWVCVNCGAPFNTLEINILRNGNVVECRACGHSITHDLYFA